jgi:hypothetical protein
MATYVGLTPKKIETKKTEIKIEKAEKTEKEKKVEKK